MGMLTIRCPKTGRALSPPVDTWSLWPSAPPQSSLAELTVHTAAQCTSGSLSVVRDFETGGVVI
jgi:hypothetical protein